MTISVVIPSYNSAATIESCLDSVSAQTLSGEYEIILVDSGADQTAPLVSGKYPHVELIHLENKTDPGTARNLGVHRAAGELIACTDSDCVVPPDWLERLAEAHRSEYNIVGGSVAAGNRPGDVVGHAGYMAEFRQFLPERPKEVTAHVPTCNISYKKTLFTRYGGFDGRFYPQEDLLFHHLLTEGGEKILFDPEIQVRHHHRSGWGEFIRHQHRIGCIAARVLKHIPLRGSAIARNPILMIPTLPLLPCIKFFNTVAVFGRCRPGYLAGHTVSLLPLAAGLIAWAVGFGRGAVSSRSPGDEKRDPPPTEAGGGKR